jgi:hypothetical protein
MAARTLRWAPFTPADDVLDAIQALCDTATVLHSVRDSDEVFIECRVCGGWEEHEHDCPMPAIHAWQEGGLRCGH